jgi:hypothetical protein
LLFIHSVGERYSYKRQYFQFYFPKNATSAAMDFDCDACACSARGSMGFSSMLNSNFVGIRYFNQSYSSRDGILPTLLGLMKISRLKFGQNPTY